MSVVINSYTGTEEGSPTIVPQGPSYNFTRQQINSLRSPLPGLLDVPVGIRLHFSATQADPMHPEKLIAIGVTGGNPTKEIFTSTGNDYILSDNFQAQTRGSVAPTLNSASTAKLTQGSDFNPNRDACVYFSNTDIQIIIDAGGGDLTHFRFHLCDFITGIGPNGNPMTFRSLVVSGRNAVGVQLGEAIRSDLPCPPHCGTDYPIEVDD